MKISPFKILCGAGLFAVFSSTISKNPVLPLFAEHLNAGPSAVGVIAAMSAFMGVVASIPAGILSDRIGRKRMLLVSAAVFATAPFLYLVVNNIWQLALVRFFHGLATAIFIPVSMALVSDLFHGERGEKLGWFSTSTLLGRFIAPLVGGSIIGALMFNPDLGYKAVYLVCGAAGVTAMLLMLGIPDTGKHMDRRNNWRKTLKTFRQVLTSHGILITAAVEAAILFAYGTFETFMPLYSLDKGLSAYEIGVFLSAQIITLALAKPIMGRFSDRHGRPPQILAGTLLGAACIGSFSLFGTFLPLLGLSVMFGLSLSIVTSATAAFIADLSRRETYGSAMGILGSVMDTGHTAGPIVSGIIAQQFGFGRSFFSAAAVLVVATSAFWMLIGLAERRPAVE